MDIISFIGSNERPILPVKPGEMSPNPLVQYCFCITKYKQTNVKRQTLTEMTKWVSKEKIKTHITLPLFSQIFQ